MVPIRFSPWAARVFRTLGLLFYEVDDSGRGKSNDYGPNGTNQPSGCTPEEVGTNSQSSWHEVHHGVGHR